jgi:hypothetical protein
LVRQTTWDYLVDAKRFREPITGLAKGFHTNPTIEVRDRLLDTTSFEKRMSTLRTIVFPAFCLQPFGLDGETFGLALRRDEVSIEWWCNGPEPWHNLTEWASEMRNWLASIAAKDPEPEQ